MKAQTNFSFIFAFVIGIILVYTSESESFFFKDFNLRLNPPHGIEVESIEPLNLLSSKLSRVQNLSVFGTIYFYKDEHGQLHFTETPTSSKFRPFLSIRAKKNDTAENREIISNHVDYFSEKYGVDNHLVMAIIDVELGGNHQASSRTGAQGLRHFLLSKQEDSGLPDQFDPKDNIEAGIQYIKELLDQFPDLSLALAAYNAGPENVKRYNGIPPFRETQEFVKKVTANYDRRRAVRE